MEMLADRLLEFLPQYGPWLLFLLAVLETSFVTGLVVPSGVATSVATILALEGQLQLPMVLLAAFAGGWTGDFLGFWIGHWFGERVFAADSRWSWRLGPRRAAVRDFYGRHPVYSVTLARLISFVRTLMPLAAGMSDLPYRRYLPYELIGLLGWVAIYVAIGYFARGSWEVATQMVGVGGTVVFIAFGLAIWLLVRRPERTMTADIEES